MEYRQSTVRIIGGVGLLIIGTALLLSNVGLIDVSWVTAHWWPLLIVMAGVLLAIRNPRSWQVPMFLVVFGILYQLHANGLVDFEPWSVVWPLIIVLVGLSFLFRGAGPRRISRNERDDVVAIAGGSQVISSANGFKQSNITAIMGGAELDLRKATFDKDASVTLFAFWGGVDIIVPNTVVVRNQLNCVLGGAEDKTTQLSDKNAPVLTIAGDVIMAGVTIGNKPNSDR